MKRIIAVPLALLLIASAAPGQQAEPSMSGGILGRVLYPDGTPSEGAKVSATTECEKMVVNRATVTKTAADGSFYIPPFLDAECNRVKLRAEKTDDLWLKTGFQVFVEGDNGTAPVIVAPRSGSPIAAEIRLGERGARVGFTVRDIATDRLIYAVLYLERMPMPGQKFSSETIATGEDGSPDTLLLPAGQYRISVNLYHCHDVLYMAARPPQTLFTVEAGQITEKEVTIDIRTIRPVNVGKSRGKPCKP
jgi:hypothetical protein